MPEASAGFRWAHVALNCRDQDVTERFYSRWFGFRRSRVVPLGCGRIVFLRLGDAHLELFAGRGTPADPAAGDGPDGPGHVRHIALQTEDLDAFLDDVAGAVTLSLGPLDFSGLIPGWRSVWLTDPDGVVVEVSQGYRDSEPGPRDTD